MLNTNDNLAYVNVISGGNVTIRGNTDSGPSNTLVGGKGSKPSYGPTNIIKKIEDTESEIRFYISPPRLNQHVGPYLMDNKAQIYDQIKASKLLKNWQSYKVYIACFSKYYKWNPENKVEFGGMYNTSKYDVINAGSGKLNLDYLLFSFNSIGDSQIQQQGNMKDSNWRYMGTAQIVIVFFKMLGKPVQIKSWVAYVGRGQNNVINVRNERDKNHLPDIAPCVVLAFRCHKYFHDKLNFTQHKEKDFEILLNNRGSPKRVHKHIWYRLRHFEVKIPPESTMTGEFTMHHWDGFERANKTPIAVHLMKNGETKEKSINVECIRVPSNSTIRTYFPTEICHMLMLTPEHVCYIPDIDLFLKQAFKKTFDHRCCFCYIVFESALKLNSHKRDGNCHRNANYSPTTMLLSQDAVIPCNNMINEMVPELSIVADAEALLSTTTSQTCVSDDVTDSDDDIDYFDVVDDQLLKERPPGFINKHIPHSIGLMSLDYQYNMLEYRSIWGTDCALKMIDTIESMILAFHNKLGPKKYYTPILTPQEYDAFRKSTHCAYCNRDYATIPNVLKHRHHDHHLPPKYGPPKMLANGKITNPLIKGNYLNSSCGFCNWQITNKRRTVYVWMHNFSQYDSALLMEGLISSRRDDMKNFTVLPKGATGYHFIQYNNIRFLDTLSFLQGSLSSIVELESKKIDPTKSNKEDAIGQVFPNTVKAIKKSRFDDKVIPLLTRKLVYPYSLPKKIEDFDLINYFPQPSAFRDDLHDCDVDQADYEYAKKVFDISGCKSLRDMHDLYLLTDCSLLSDCWRSYNNEIFNTFGLHPSNFISGPALSFAAGLKQSKTDIELLYDESMYEIFQNTIRGGFCAVNQRHARANNVDMSSYDENSNTSMIFFKDFNSLYGECLTEKMPFKSFKYVDEATLSLYQNNPKLFMEIDVEDNKAYIVTCDFDIPENLARFTDMMPLSIVNTTHITPSPYIRS